MTGKAKRQVKEPGGILLIGVGMALADLDNALAQIYDKVSSVTVLVDVAQQKHKLKADEVWVYGALGLRGAMALIRRMSWRRFDTVYQPQKQYLPYLRFFIWPRPPWVIGGAGDEAIRISR